MHLGVLPCVRYSSVDMYAPDEKFSTCTEGTPADPSPAISSPSPINYLM